MFCFKCGREVEKFMKFCPKCGVSLENLVQAYDCDSNATEISKDNNSSYKNPPVQETAGVQFEYQGKIISFSDKEVLYNEIRKRIMKLADQIILDYEKKYKEFGDSSTFLREGNSTVMHYIDVMLDMIVSSMIEMEIYDTTKKSLLNDYGEYFLTPWLDAYATIEEKYISINASAEELNQYRTARRQNRGRFVGGGFGIQGALKGTVKAGALNFVTGAAHGLFNIAGSITSSIIDSSKKSEIYNDKNTISCLKNGLYNTMVAIANVYCMCCRVEVPAFDDAKVCSLLSNLKIIPKEKRIDIICECIKTNPYNKDTYTAALNEFSYGNANLKKIAIFFGVDVL